MASVLDRVREIAADKLSVELEEINPESSFTEDLEADSLDVVELIMELMIIHWKFLMRMQKKFLQ